MLAQPVEVVKDRRCILLAATVLGVAGLFYIALPRRLPSYQGQSLAVWFEKLPPTVLGWGAVYTERWEPKYPGWYMAGNITYNTTNRGEWHRTLKAIQTIGTNGLPYIMEKFTREDNRFEQWLGKAASTIGIRLSVSDPQQERRQAFTALLANSPLPPDVVATLKALSSSSNGDISSKATFVLSKTTGDHIVRLE